MKEIRELIKNQIRKADGALSEHDDQMTFTPGLNQIQSKYRVTVGSYVTSRQLDNYFEDTYQVELRLFRKADMKKTITFDTCVDYLRNIRSKIISPIGYANTKIGSVVSTGFRVSEYASNQDIFELTLNLTFQVSNPL